MFRIGSIVEKVNWIGPIEKGCVGHIGRSPGVRIALSNGQYIYVSNDHKFVCGIARDLKVGDEFPIVRRTWGGEMLQIAHRCRGKHWYGEFGTDEAAFFGAFVYRGSIHRRPSDRTPDGVKAHKWARRDSTVLADFTTRNFGVPPLISLPDWIYSQTEESILSFLEEMFEGNPPWRTISWYAARGVACLAAMVGYPLKGSYRTKYKLRKGDPEDPVKIVSIESHPDLLVWDTNESWSTENCPVDQKFCSTLT